MPETCKNYILNCSQCRSISASIKLLSVAVSVMHAVSFSSLTAHKFNKQGARARTQDSCFSITLPLALLPTPPPVLPPSPALTYLCLNCSAGLCGCSEACSLEGSADRQRQCCCSSPKPKQNQLPVACCLPPNVGNINSASNTHTHTPAHRRSRTHMKPLHCGQLGSKANSSNKFN